MRSPALYSRPQPSQMKSPSVSKCDAAIMLPCIRLSERGSIIAVMMVNVRLPARLASLVILGLTILSQGLHLSPIESYLSKSCTVMNCLVKQLGGQAAEQALEGQKNTAGLVTDHA
jgi:hypothetical protein